MTTYRRHWDDLPSAPLREAGGADGFRATGPSGGPAGFALAKAASPRNGARGAGDSPSAAAAANPAWLSGDHLYDDAPTRSTERLEAA
jgi:hypothetical protein